MPPDFLLVAVGTPFGPVRIAAVEDCIAKRLASAKHWRIPSDMDQANPLLETYRETLDWDYLRLLSKPYVVEDLLSDLERAHRDRVSPARSKDRVRSA